MEDYLRSDREFVSYFRKFKDQIKQNFKSSKNEFRFILKIDCKYKLPNVDPLINYPVSLYQSLINPIFFVLFQDISEIKVAAASINEKFPGKANVSDFEKRQDPKIFVFYEGEFEDTYNRLLLTKDLFLFYKSFGKFFQEGNVPVVYFLNGYKITKFSALMTLYHAINHPEQYSKTNILLEIDKLVDSFSAIKSDY